MFILCPSLGAIYQTRPNHQYRLHKNYSSLLHPSLTLHHPNTSIGVLGIDHDENKVNLMALKSYKSKRKDELNFRKGDALVGVRIDYTLWMATSATGKTGLVTSDKVAVQSKTSAPSAPDPKASLAWLAPPPGGDTALSSSSSPPPGLSPSSPAVLPPPWDLTRQQAPPPGDMAASKASKYQGGRVKSTRVGRKPSDMRSRLEASLNK